MGKVFQPLETFFPIIADTSRLKILVINPGSTSTKVSLYEGEKSLFEKSLFHDAPQLLKFPHVNDQMPFRRDVILAMLKDEGVAPESIDAFVGRGGSACSQPGGLIRIDKKLFDDTVAGVGGFYGSDNVHDDVNKRICAVISGGTVNSLTIADAGYVRVSGATVNNVVMSKGNVSASASAEVPPGTRPRAPATSSSPRPRVRSRR